MAEPTLTPTRIVDSDHPDVEDYARRHAVGRTETDRAVALFYAVRDGFRYDPYQITLTPDGMKASTVLANGYGWCVPKATLLTAACRASGIPARLGFADVRNHLSTQRMRDVMGTDIFSWHGFSEIWLEGRWVKATPAFNIELCERFDLLPLEFNGRDDSLYHRFDRHGHEHMEYVAQRGTFDDVPLDMIIEDFRVRYPMWRSELGQSSDFAADVVRETGG
ncbi:MAG: transglutaminase family protein [Candidatus Nanopelagicales bacterium]